MVKAVDEVNNGASKTGDPDCHAQLQEMPLGRLAKTDRIDGGGPAAASPSFQACR
jgi:hypothetical protein